MEFKNANEIKKAVRKSLGSSPRATVVRVAEGDTSLAIHVIYHETIIVRLVLNPKGTRVDKIVLNTGGFGSQTTAGRMSCVLHVLETEHFVSHKRVSTKGMTFNEKRFGRPTWGTGTAMLDGHLPIDETVTLTRRGNTFLIAK